jgi:hypothetical protein
VGLLQTTLSVLQRSGSGAEAASVSPAGHRERIESLYERARDSALPDNDNQRFDEKRQKAIAACLEAGRQALRSVAADGLRSRLSGEQRTGLEAIIRLTGRPSFLISQGCVAGVPRKSEWREPLAAAEAEVRQVIVSVGRVDLPGARGPGFAGTAFMVTARLVMTNRHVAERFAAADVTGSWMLNPNLHPTVDFTCEHERISPPPWKIVGVHWVHPKLDLALLRVEPTAEVLGNGPAPLPLSASSKCISGSRQVYNVGFPAYDPLTESQVLKEIFGDIFNVKRFAPGEVTGRVKRDGSFGHDCSTLGGNSGSCIVDFSNHRVIGLHFGSERSFFQLQNRALSLPGLIQDTELSRAGLQYA